MTDRTPSKAVPGGEPPTPEGWTIYGHKDQWGQDNRVEGPLLEVGERVRVAPVGGAGQEEEGEHQGTWRVGRKVGRTIYRQLGPEPSDGDPLIGVMDTPALAFEAAQAHNVAAAGVGGTGVRLTDEEARACLSAVSDNDWAYYIADQGAEFLDALKAKLRASVGEGAKDG